MTLIAPLTAVSTDLASAAAPPPVRAREHVESFSALIDVNGGAADGADLLRAPRVRSPQGTGEAFEAAMLVPFVAAMLPPEDAEIWGGTGGAMWRGLFADALAEDVARAGGIGLAALVERTLAARIEPSTPNTGDPA